jgi:hypothetical protein
MQTPADRLDCPQPGLESVKKNDQVADVGMVSRYLARLFSSDRTTAKRRGFNLTL